MMINLLNHHMANIPAGRLFPVLNQGSGMIRCPFLFLFVYPLIFRSSSRTVSSEKPPPKLSAPRIGI